MNPRFILSIALLILSHSGWCKGKSKWKKFQYNFIAYTLDSNSSQVDTINLSKVKFEIFNREKTKLIKTVYTNRKGLKTVKMDINKGCFTFIKASCIGFETVENIFVCAGIQRVTKQTWEIVFTPVNKE